MLTVDDLQAYDAEIRDRVWKHDGPAEIFEAVVVEHARETAKTCGFAAVSVPAALAYDAKSTVEAAVCLEKEIGLPNVAIEIPATEQGAEALELCIFQGVNASATLIFSNAHYREVIEAYMSALEHRIAQGLDVRGISSYAKFYVDPMLAARACAKLAGDLHASLFASERWSRIHAFGAHSQPLMIVPTTGGEDIEPIERADAERVLAELYERGVSLDDHLEKLLHDAIETRAAADLALFTAIEAKRRALPTTAPDVPDQREIADLGMEHWALPGGYDLA